MIRLFAIAALLLGLVGCVDAMPPHDENNRILNQSVTTEAPESWRPRMLLE